MRSTHRARTLLIAAAVVAGTCALTACHGGDANSKAGTTSATATTDADTPADKDSAATKPGASAGAGDSAGTGSATDSAGTSADDDAAADDDSPAGVDGGVSGTFTGGTIEYLAPQKYIVRVDGKQQQFYVSKSTAVYGAGVLCGEYDPKATTRCSQADLESNTKSGSVAADVVVKSGVATRITERAAPDEGPAVDDD